jgi:hypothetical protein
MTTFSQIVEIREFKTIKIITKFTQIVGILMDFRILNEL